MTTSLKSGSKAFHPHSWAPQEEGAEKPLAFLKAALVCVNKEKQNSLQSSDLGNSAARGKKWPIPKQMASHHSNPIREKN